MLSSTVLKFSRLAVRPFASLVGDQYGSDASSQRMSDSSSKQNPSRFGNPGGDPGKRNQKDDATNAFTGIKGVKYQIQEDDGLQSKQENEIMKEMNMAEKLRDEDPAGAEVDARKNAEKDHIRENAVEAGESTEEVDKERPELRGGRKYKEGPSITFPESAILSRDELEDKKK